MVTIEKKQILIDGKSIFLLSGECHYYRQPRENWQHLMDEAKALGLNCIASYVPWLMHEETQGQFDFSGNLDLGAFIDLCKENGLYFFVRPGPFIMAEMKNDGPPYWIRETYPDALPVGFENTPAGGNTVDYLNENYLRACREWYRHVMPIIVPRLHQNGGNIIGVQLDNEIGMLNWVGNKPVLNDPVLRRFRAWLKEKGLTAHYPLDIDNDDLFFSALRAPQEAYAAQFHLDYGDFLRDYYAEYVRILKTYAQEEGVVGPLFINLHGTGDSRIFDYPISLSQLYRAWNQDGDFVSGTDVYLGEPREGTYQDMYVANVLTQCMNKKGSPLTSIEFECSDGPYCSLDGMRNHPNATSQNILMNLSQGAKMLSFYVFAGGVNVPLRHPRPDGSGRIAFTGELHGWNAPVQPDNTRNFAFGRIARTMKAVHALNPLIARSAPVTDDVVLGFMPDYFLTEMCYTKSESTCRIHQNLKTWRCAGAIDNAARGLLGHGVHFTAADIQNEAIPQTKLLMVLSARYMAREMQEKLKAYIENGGQVFLYGEMPVFDLAGNPCTVLLDAFRLSQPEYRQNSWHPAYFATPEAVGAFEGSASAPSISMLQVFSRDEDAVLVPWGEDKMCGFLKSLGQGRLLAVTCDYPADMGFFKRLLSLFDITPSVHAPYWRQGLYVGCTKSEDGQRLLYVLNLDSEEKTVDIHVEGEVLLHDIRLAEKAAYLLPAGVKVQNVTVLSSTAEIVGMDERSVTLRCTQPGGDRILLKGRPAILENQKITAEAVDGNTLLTTLGTAIHDEMTLYWA